MVRQRSLPKRPNLSIDVPSSADAVPVEGAACVEAMFHHFHKAQAAVSATARRYTGRAASPRPPTAEPLSPIRKSSNRPYNLVSHRSASAAPRAEGPHPVPGPDRARKPLRKGVAAFQATSKIYQSVPFKVRSPTKVVKPSSFPRQHMLSRSVDAAKHPPPPGQRHIKDRPRAASAGRRSAAAKNPLGANRHLPPPSHPAPPPSSAPVPTPVLCAGSEGRSLAQAPADGDPLNPIGRAETFRLEGMASHWFLPAKSRAEDTICAHHGVTERRHCQAYFRVCCEPPASAGPVGPLGYH
ncbi:hypothetical protein CYMTET_25996 [Cymbomonas tetramitiformis]|uniref:Uncharacterized protein n=1 Tax=Cymbomonas tetramitiformis TaxID=36881 RepID=A0AAE0KYN9_9CHLO|nr:hypothetical protein CYMTET_25996 [Cymbomonas tetramitiformis]